MLIYADGSALSRSVVGGAGGPDDPQLAARNMIQSIPHPAAGPIKVLGSPIKLSRTPATLRKLPPDLAPPSGQD